MRPDLTGQFSPFASLKYTAAEDRPAYGHRPVFITKEEGLQGCQ